MSSLEDKDIFELPPLLLMESREQASSFSRSQQDEDEFSVTSQPIQNYDTRSKSPSKEPKYVTFLGKLTNPQLDAMRIYLDSNCDRINEKKFCLTDDLHIILKFHSQLQSLKSPKRGQFVKYLCEQLQIHMPFTLVSIKERMCKKLVNIDVEDLMIAISQKRNLVFRDRVLTPEKVIITQSKKKQEERKQPTQKKEKEDKEGKQDKERDIQQEKQQKKTKSQEKQKEKQGEKQEDEEQGKRETGKFATTTFEELMFIHSLNKLTGRPARRMTMKSTKVSHQNESEPVIFASFGKK